MGTFIAQKIFLNQSDESEEAAKELMTKAEEAKAKTEADDGAKRAEEKATKSAAVKLAGTKQKIKKQAATDKQNAWQVAAGGQRTSDVRYGIDRRVPC